MSCEDGAERQFMHATGVEMGLLLGLCSFGIAYFRAQEVSRVIVCLVLLSWWLGFYGTILLTADLAEASGKCRHLKPPTWLEISWAIVYWTTFVLAWAILPVVYYYCLSGEFTRKARFLSALRSNMKFAVCVLVLAACFIGYLVISGSMELQAIFGLAIALGNAYGLLFVILLIGNGLIRVPRWLWASSFPDRELDILFFRATEVDSKLYDAFYTLKDTEDELKSFENEPSLVNQCSIVKATCYAFDMASNAPDGTSVLTDLDASPARPSRGQGTSNATCDVRKLADLHRRIKCGQERLIACRQRWNTLVMRAELVSAVLEGNLPYPHGTDDVHQGAISGILLCCKLVCKRFLWLWHSKLERNFMRCCSMVTWSLSILILWSEHLKVTLAFKWDMSPFGRLLEITAKMNNPIITQVVVMIPFLYMNFCCFQTLFKMHFFGNFALSGPHHSHTGPLLFNGQYLVRLQFALGYNFLMILRHGITTRPTAFSKLMSSMEAVPILGTEFNVYTPVVIVVVCASTIWYSRLLQLVGFDHEDILSTMNSGGYERLDEGRRIIERDRRRSELRGLWDDSKEIDHADLEIPVLHNNLDDSYTVENE